MKSRDTSPDSALFGSDLWRAALEKYASATHLTVTLFDTDAGAVFGPVHSTPLYQLFHEAGYDPGIFAECARRCVAQTKDRPPVLVAQFHGLAVVGASLLVEGKIVGAAVGGYAFVDFSQVAEIQRLAQQSGVVFERVWEIARKQPPVPQRRLIVHGELLQVLGDALLRENYRTRQYKQAAAIISSSDDAIVSEDLNGVITSWNYAAERLYGYPAQEAIGQPIAMLVPADRQQEEPENRAQIVRGERIDHVETVRVRKNGSPLEISLTISPIEDSVGHVIGASQIARDITERRQAENALRISEERFRALFELGPIAVYSCDASGVIQEFNQRAAELWGRTPTLGDADERFCGSFKMVRPDGSGMAHEDCPMAEVLSGKIPEIRDAEVIIQQPTGARVSVIVNIRPLKNQHGEVTGAINCFYDITARNQAESHREFLMAELDHRLKNTLATVQGIAKQTGQRSSSLADFRRTFEARLLALSQTHSLLRAGEWKGTGLHEMIAAELSPYRATENERLTIEGDDVRLDPRQALSLGMALHELTTNAVKYGALSTAEGKLKVEWRVSGVNGGPMLQLRWTESDGPVVVEPSSRGFGTQLIEHGLANDLDADVHLEFNPGGLRFTLSVALEPLQV